MKLKLKWRKKCCKFTTESNKKQAHTQTHIYRKVNNFHNHQSVSNVIIMISINKTPIIMLLSRTHTPKVTVTWICVFSSRSFSPCLAKLPSELFFRHGASKRAWYEASNEMQNGRRKKKCAACSLEYERILLILFLTHQYYHITTILLKHIIIKHCYYES